jgi:hypothetical protein
LCSEAEKKEHGDVEDAVWPYRLATYDKDILEEVRDWVDDPFYSRTRETNYFIILDIYWIVKALVE